MRNLVKGYGDTHARGQAKFDRLAALIPRVRGRSDAAAILEALIKAALADEGGQALDKAIAGLDAAEPASSATPGARG
jgi:indolepyruvate ferredoxin oxidoreductase beta subunit